MTDPPDLLLSLYTVISLHHRPRPRLHLSANCLLCLPGLMTLYFSFFALSRWPYPIAPYLACKHFYFPDSKLYIKVTNLPLSLFHPDPFSFSTLLLFLPHLLCFLPRYSLKIPIVALLLIYLPVALLPTLFLAAFAIESPLYLGFFQRSTFGAPFLALCVQMYNWLAALYHEHSAVSATPILLRNVPIALCPIFGL